MANTIFKKIIAKDIPSHVVYEDEHNLAFLDINPHAKGHTLVIPKTDPERFADMKETEVQSLFVAVQKTMARIQEVLGPDGFNVGWNDGKAGGQMVEHVHVHILPRYDGDGGGSMHAIVKADLEISVEEVAQLFA